MPRLVVGLGNPGRAYEKTRHNVGFTVIDRCCARLGAEPTKKSFEARYCFVHGAAAGGDQAGFVKPQTYMNLSGEAVRGFCDFYKVEADQVLVVCDDLALPVGQLRLRAGGSAGGQKGLESIIRHLGTDRFARCRVGIGAPPPPVDAADYVLGQFGEEERPVMEAAVERAADAVRMWLFEGIERAMNVFNARPESEKAKKERAEKGAEGRPDGPPDPRREGRDGKRGDRAPGSGTSSDLAGGL